MKNWLPYFCLFGGLLGMSVAGALEDEERCPVKIIDRPEKFVPQWNFELTDKVSFSTETGLEEWDIMIEFDNPVKELNKQLIQTVQNGYGTPLNIEDASGRIYAFSNEKTSSNTKLSGSFAVIQSEEDTKYSKIQSIKIRKHGNEGGWIETCDEPEPVTAVLNSPPKSKPVRPCTPWYTVKNIDDDALGTSTKEYHGTMTIGFSRKLIGEMYEIKVTFDKEIKDFSMPQHSVKQSKSEPKRFTLRYQWNDNGYDISKHQGSLSNQKGARYIWNTEDHNKVGRFSVNLKKFTKITKTARRHYANVFDGSELPKPAKIVVNVLKNPRDGKRKVKETHILCDHWL